MELRRRQYLAVLADVLEEVTRKSLSLPGGLQQGSQSARKAHRTFLELQGHGVRKSACRLRLRGRQGWGCR